MKFGVGVIGKKTLSRKPEFVKIVSRTLVIHLKVY